MRCKQIKNIAQASNKLGKQRVVKTVKLIEILRKSKMQTKTKTLQEILSVFTKYGIIN